MKENYGSISLRKDGYYYGRVSYNKIKKSFYGKSKKEVQDKLNAWVAEIRDNNVTSENVILFSEYCRNYLFSYKYGFIKNTSFDKLEEAVECHIKKSKIDVPLYKLDDVLVQNYLNTKRDYSYSLIKRIFQIVRMVLVYAYKKSDISVNLADLIVCPKSTKKPKKMEVYSDNEVNMFYKAVDDMDLINSALYPYLLSSVIVLDTGMRIGELLALRWNEVDFDKREISIKNTVSMNRQREGDNGGWCSVITEAKTATSRRTVPMNDLVYSCLCKLHDIADSEFVLSKDGNFVVSSNFRVKFCSLCGVLGVKYKGVHALRHTFASRLVRAGVPSKVVSDLLGHSSVMFTIDRYVHSYSSDYVDAVRLLHEAVYTLSGDVIVDDS